MTKTKYYYDTIFSSKVIKEAHECFLSKLQSTDEEPPQTLSLDFNQETWDLDSIDEFFAQCDRSDSSHIDHILDGGRLIVDHRMNNSARIMVKLENRGDIESVFNKFEKYVDSSKIVSEEKPLKIFIGHGQNNQWRDLKDHLQEEHGLEVFAYEIGPRAGLSVKEVLEKMLDDSSMAFLVLTGEDEHTDGKIHARENVIHELGLFQGRIGFTRAIALLERGVVEFSNILGLNQIRFSKGNIRETFGDVVATIRREFENSD